uniref:Uncharacterized protein n=1 Tax=Knipowitschia caucasica TaxID=637954 RepID=A0AAV2KUT7_KNICA
MVRQAEEVAQQITQQEQQAPLAVQAVKQKRFVKKGGKPQGERSGGQRHGYQGESKCNRCGKKNNNPAYPDYTPSIFPQAVLKELTKSTTLDRFKRAQKRKAPSTTLVSRKERKVKKQLEFEETSVPEELQQEVCSAEISPRLPHDTCPVCRKSLRKKNNNPAYPDYTPSIFPQAVLKELTKSTTLDRFKKEHRKEKLYTDKQQ